MILNARQNSFLFLFPPTFFSKEIVADFHKYINSYIMPYQSIHEFMASTIQSIEISGLQMDPVAQTGFRGQQREYKNAKPIKELFTRKFTISFKIVDGYLNYFLFVKNALEYFDFDNPDQHLDPMILGVLTNEGHLVFSLEFKQPYIMDWSNASFAFNSITPTFNTFDVTFGYNIFDLRYDYN
jgi:hypothetical protein